MNIFSTQTNLDGLQIIYLCDEINFELIIVENRIERWGENMAGERTESLSQLNINSDFAILSVQMDSKMTSTYLQRQRSLIIHSRNKTRWRFLFLTNAFNSNEKCTSSQF